MKKDDFVQVSRADLIDVLRDLNTIVVSIDRIGSCAEDVGLEQNDRILLDFFDQWDVWQKLSEARSKLSEPFSYELGEDNMDELERELQGTPYWSFSNRLPPEKSAKREQINQEILEVKQNLIDGMIEYMKYGGAVDENDPEYDPEFDAGYTQKHVDRCSEIINDFLASLERTPEKAHQNEYIMDAVKKTI